jgi:hypothetical protein
MSKLAFPAAALALSLLAAPAVASNGGDRSPAGGAFMSTYSNGPSAGRAQQPAEPVFDAVRPGRGEVGTTGSVAPRRPVYDRR